MLNTLKLDIARYKKSGKLIYFPYLLFFESGFTATFLYRVYSKLHKKSAPLKFLSKILWRCSVVINGCYLQPNATIGKGFKLPHPIGVVVGEGCEIKDNVCIYQNVTLGKSSSGYPTINNGCIIYPNSVVVGNITIGTNSIIAASSFVNTDVEPSCIVAGSPAQKIKNNHA